MYLVDLYFYGQNYCNHRPNSGTIHHNTCSILLANNRKSARCEQCAKFRKNLYVHNSRLEKRTLNQADPSSSVPYCALSTKEMSERIKNLHNELCKIRKKQQRLKQLIEESVDVHGMTGDDCLHTDLKEMVKECETQMEGVTLNSFKWVFWQQQMEAASKSDSRAMRWHPLMIRWCIYLLHQSQAAY